MHDWGRTLLHIPTMNQQAEMVNYSIILLSRTISLSPIPDSKRRNQSCGHVYYLVCTKCKLITTWFGRNDGIGIILDSQAYYSFTGSDHRIVSARIRLSFRANSKIHPKKVKYDRSLLQKDSEIQDKYSLEVRNKYTILNDTCEQRDSR